VSGSACPHCAVKEDGCITCQKIAGADTEVSPAICQHCPARACDCGFLRFTLSKIVLTPVTVRWADGRVEVWNSQPPRVLFLRSACALKKTPLASSLDCLGCAWRRSPVTMAPKPPADPQVRLPVNDNVLPFVTRPRGEQIVPSTSS
jgi:hypothetical protein